MQHLISKSVCSCGKAKNLFYGDLNVFLLFEPNYFEGILCDYAFYDDVRERLSSLQLSIPIFILEDVDFDFICCFGFIGLNTVIPKNRLKKNSFCAFWADAFQLLRELNVDFTFLCYPFSANVPHGYVMTHRARSMLNRLVKFSNSGRTEYLEYLGDRRSIQYFTDDFYHVRDNEVFIDVGGFDGDSSDYFFSQARDNGRSNVSSVIIEPNKAMGPKINDRLRRYEKIYRWTLHQVCLGESNANVSVSIDGSKSRVNSDEPHGELVHMITGDSLMLNPTVIKIDVEGFEIEVLNGFAKTVKRFKPTILVAIYHRPTDLSQIAQLLFDWGYRHLDIDKFTDGLSEIIARFDVEDAKYG